MSRPKAILGLEVFEERLCPASPNTTMTVQVALESIDSHPDIAINQSIINGQLLARQLLTNMKNANPNSPQVVIVAKLVNDVRSSGNLANIEKNISATAAQVVNDGSLASLAAFHKEVTVEASLAFGFMKELEQQFSTAAQAQNALNYGAYSPFAAPNPQADATAAAFKRIDSNLQASFSYIQNNLEGQTCSHAATAFGTPLVPDEANVTGTITH